MYEFQGLLGLFFHLLKLYKVSHYLYLHKGIHAIAPVTETSIWIIAFSSSSRSQYIGAIISRKCQRSTNWSFFVLLDRSVMVRSHSDLLLLEGHKNNFLYSVFVYASAQDQCQLFEVKVCFMSVMSIP